MSAQIAEIELEAKSMFASKEDFEKVRDYLMLTPTSFVPQVNCYFVDKDGVIRTKLPEGTTLRVRRKKGTFRLQFKLMKSDGTSPEYEDIFYEDDDPKYNSLFSEGIVFEGNVRGALVENGVNPDAVVYLSNGQTMRYSAVEQVIKYRNPSWLCKEICLDENTFPGGVIDYEIEVEHSESLEESERILGEILAANGLKKIPAKRKVDRFYEAFEEYVK